MNQKVLLILLIMVTFSATSQELLSFKGRSYHATNSLDFICENYALTGIAAIQIAKTENGGILKLAVATTNPTFNISGVVYVYLTDNTIIICSDKGIRENIENKIVSYYTFSPLEMNKMKITDIQSIRFNIKGNASKFSSQIGNFTAVNRKTYFSTASDKTKKNYDTATQITTLYQ
ncbi:hypothetical protein [Flavobacterium sp. AED]|uniref:hypothetical protein n=1 Tax=Flavobacterium sp. AED TaxID=1423323 RepID=UPI00057FAABA|nr:hypothetical protein [Flavobacterium sp. AED]KIA86207.1 hypothetical protein OA85_00550 [Flavobacterium sp. AED]MDI1304766.1 hypothetical protein [bacterium]